MSTTPDPAALAAILDELERLHKAADPGVWSLDDSQLVQSGILVIGPNGDWLAEVYDRCTKPYQPAVLTPEARASARLIMVARNALPDLIRLARQALAAELAARNTGDHNG